VKATLIIITIIFSIIFIIIIIIIISKYPVLFELRHILELQIVYFMILPDIVVTIYSHSHYNALVQLAVPELWRYVAGCFCRVVEAFVLAECFVVFVGSWLPTTSDT